MNPMFSFHRNTYFEARYAARLDSAPRTKEVHKAPALDRWENEGGKILPFPQSFSHAMMAGHGTEAAQA